ncbi:MAG: hypothetical protein L6Q40_11015 [Azonexus sp.]|nr:hypothetical protein [Azonexus sp.]
MEIASIGSSGAYANSGIQAAQPQSASQEAPVERSERRPESQETSTAEAPRPVVNAQGQQTGTLINVTA